MILIFMQKRRKKTKINPILKYPPYHRALTHGYLRQESRFTVPAYMIVLMLSYLCDFSCYKCGLIQSKNKNIQVNICMIYV